MDESPYGRHIAPWIAKARDAALAGATVVALSSLYTRPRAGALHVRKFMLKLFDREDGMAADWPLIAAFHALDQSPSDPRVLTLLRRVHAGSYDRLTGNPPDSHPPLDGAQNPASDLAD